MRYLSVCSGIEAATVAWHSLDWTPVAFSEIEPFPSAVLAHHYPDVPNWGDMTKYQEWPDADIDVLVGGTPCQSFSVAGLRKGLDDPRGNLMLTFGAIAQRYRPRWLVWENVPGVLSSNGGRDFGTFLGMLAELGYGFAYRVLDAQYVRVDSHPRAVPQRRRRVFVVGHLGDWRRPAAVLLERESLSGHPAPRREAGKAAPTIPSRSTAGGGLGTDFDCDGGLIPDVTGALTARFGGNAMGAPEVDAGLFLPEVCGTLSDGAHMGGGLNGQDAYTGRVIPVALSLRTDGFDASEDGTGRGTRGQDPVVAVPPIWRAGDQANAEHLVDCAGTISTNKGSHGGIVAHPLRTDGFDASEDGTGRGAPIVVTQDSCPVVMEDGSTPALKVGTGLDMGQPPAIAFHENQRGEITVNDTAGTLKVGGGKPGQGYPAIAVQERAVSENPDAGPQGAGFNADGSAYTLEARTQKQAVAFQSSQSGVRTDDVHATLDSNNGSRRHNGVILPHMAVRRLTPRECERLQGFPDDYTLIPVSARKKIEQDYYLYLRRTYPTITPQEAQRLARDGPRYKALGNSMATNVMRWIGQRIEMVDEVVRAAQGGTDG